MEPMDEVRGNTGDQDQGGRQDAIQLNGENKAAKSLNSFAASLSTQ